MGWPEDQDTGGRGADGGREGGGRGADGGREGGGRGEDGDGGRRCGGRRGRGGEQWRGACDRRGACASVTGVAGGVPNWQERLDTTAMTKPIHGSAAAEQA